MTAKAFGSKALAATAGTARVTHLHCARVRSCTCALPAAVAVAVPPPLAPSRTPNDSTGNT